MVLPSLATLAKIKLSIAVWSASYKGDRDCVSKERLPETIKNVKTWITALIPNEHLRDQFGMLDMVERIGFQLKIVHDTCTCFDDRWGWKWSCVGIVVGVEILDESLFLDLDLTKNIFFLACEFCDEDTILRLWVLLKNLSESIFFCDRGLLLNYWILQLIDSADTREKFLKTRHSIIYFMRDPNLDENMWNYCVKLRKMSGAMYFEQRLVSREGSFSINEHLAYTSRNRHCFIYTFHVNLLPIPRPLSLDLFMSHAEFESTQLRELLEGFYATPFLNMVRGVMDDLIDESSAQLKHVIMCDNRLNGVIPYFISDPVLMRFFNDPIVGKYCHDGFCLEFLDRMLWWGHIELERGLFLASFFRVSENELRSIVPHTIRCGGRGNHPWPDWYRWFHSV